TEASTVSADLLLTGITSTVGVNLNKNVNKNQQPVLKDASAKASEEQRTMQAKELQKAVWILRLLLPLQSNVVQEGDMLEEGSDGTQRSPQAILVEDHHVTVTFIREIVQRILGNSSVPSDDDQHALRHLPLRSPHLLLDVFVCGIDVVPAQHRRAPGFRKF